MTKPIHYALPARDVGGRSTRMNCTGFSPIHGEVEPYTEDSTKVTCPKCIEDLASLTETALGGEGCQRCEGSGSVTNTSHLPGVTRETAVCPHCNGRGYL